MKVVFAHLGMEHLGIEFLSAVIKERGHECGLVHDPGYFSTEDNVLCNPFLEGMFKVPDVAEQVLDQEPDLVAFSAYTTNYRWCLETARRIKELEPDLPILFGGIHCTLVPEKVIVEDCVDFVHCGEGEDTFPEFVDTLERHGPDAAARVDNIVTLDASGEIRKNPIRPLTRHLDTLPFPDKELFAQSYDFGMDYMLITSRGCTYSCSFCSETFLRQLYGKRIQRRRTVDDVMTELLEAKAKYNIKEVMFFDAIFFSDEQFVLDLMERYRDEIGVPFRCVGHVNMLTPALAKALAEAGCYSVDFGLQSLSPRIRKEICNRRETNEAAHRAFSLCDENQMHFDVDLIFGLPSMTEEDYELALRFFKEHPYLNRLKCFYLSYYPRLPMIGKALELGVITAEDVEKIESGEIGDWHHEHSITDPAHILWTENFSRVYKLYPLIPKRLIDPMLDRKWYRTLNKLPKPAVIGGQVAIGLMKKDYRFWIYISQYWKLFGPKKVRERRAMRQRARVRAAKRALARAEQKAAAK